jgi:hypothetical protein
MMHQDLTRPQHRTEPLDTGPMTRRRVLSRLRRRTVTLGTCGLVLLATAGAAFAYFTSTGSSTASASTGTLTVSISATAGTPTTALYPGGTGDVTLQVNNPSNHAVTLTSVVQDGTITASGGCTAPDLTFTVPAADLPVSIPANANGFQVDLSGAAALSTASPDSCQGATFSIPVTITVES